MVYNRLKSLPAFRLGLVILCLLTWAAPGLAADAAPLPAKDWNLRQVERLKAPPGDSLTFAVLGDSRSNPAVFAGVLKAMADDPAHFFYHYLKVALRGDQVDVQVQRLATSENQ